MLQVYLGKNQHKRRAIADKIYSNQHIHNCSFVIESSIFGCFYILHAQTHPSKLASNSSSFREDFGLLIGLLEPP